MNRFDYDDNFDSDNDNDDDEWDCKESLDFAGEANFDSTDYEDGIMGEIESSEDKEYWEKEMGVNFL